jgi:hypothetical protein
VFFQQLNGELPQIPIVWDLGDELGELRQIHFKADKLQPLKTPRENLIKTKIEMVHGPSQRKNTATLLTDSPEVNRISPKINAPNLQKFAKKRQETEFRLHRQFFERIRSATRNSRTVA